MKPFPPEYNGRWRRALRRAAFLVATVGLTGAIGWLIQGWSGAVTYGGLGVACLIAGLWYDKVILWRYNAEELTDPDTYLCRAVRLVAERAQLPVPRVFVIPTPSPNAFAVGRGRQRAAFAITEGTAAVLNEEELLALISLGLAHIRTRQTFWWQLVAVVSGICTIPADVARAAITLSRSDDKNASPFYTFVVFFVAPVAAAIMRLSIDASEAYQADRESLAVYGNVEATKSMLLKLTECAAVIPFDKVIPSTAHLFVVNPLPHTWFWRIFVTQPETTARLEGLS